MRHSFDGARPWHRDPLQSAMQAKSARVRRAVQPKLSDEILDRWLLATDQVLRNTQISTFELWIRRGSLRLNMAFCHFLTYK